MHRHSGCIIHEHATRIYFKNKWAELSYEFGPSCLINLGRVGMGRVLCGPSWHGPSWFWAELSVILLALPNCMHHCKLYARELVHVGLGLAIDPPPPQGGTFVHYDFLKQHYIRHKIKDVSPLRGAALTCNIPLYMLPPK